MNKTHFIRSMLFTLIAISAALSAHDGPDPIAHWQFKKGNLKNSHLQARLGPDGVFNADPATVDDRLGQSVRFNGRQMECLIAEDLNSVREFLPIDAMTISAWVAIDVPQEWGGIFGAIQDNGEAESGWLLGYNNESKFTFTLASEGVDDGDGKLTWIVGQSRFEPGKMYHVCAVYDGTAMQLYVNGKLEAESHQQNGKILYPKGSPLVIGSYRDDNECYSLTGRVREIALYDIAAKPKWIAKEFMRQLPVAELPRQIPPGAAQFIVQPYLQFGTQTGMSVVWRNQAAVDGKLHWGETIRCENAIATKEPAEIQTIRIENLEPETQYFYWVESVGADGQPIEGDVSTFQTASRTETPFAFAVIGDTQENPAVSGPIAKLAWAHRPNFLLHAGDLVDQGKMNDDWIDEFFASMHPLISRVPMYPVLGNHEQDAKNYYDYMALPDPEYYYKFSHGNAEFFMIDSNRNVEPGSEQYRWLDQSLHESTATWKFACHHHPPYSSDENDYGDLWKTNRSSRGDLRLRDLVPLYEKHGVDIVWNGHIHSYERTWPLKGNKAVEVNGTIYMITGGGGGGLETPGPYRPFFQNCVRHGHHYVIVAINGTTLEMKTFSLSEQMFDTVKIEKCR